MEERERDVSNMQYVRKLGVNQDTSSWEADKARQTPIDGQRETMRDNLR